jgi:hypothetical protein
MVERSTALARKTAWLLAAMSAMLAASVIAFLLHAPAPGLVLMALMAVCGIAAIIVALAAYSRLKVEQANLMRNEMAYRQRRTGGTDY